jgi:glutaredoxin
VVSALQETGIPFETFDILSNPEIRQGLKEFSNWPTYPQLYAKGEFIGGCDIIEELHAEGELKETLEDALGGPGPAPTPPAPPAATPVAAAAPTKASATTFVDS